jgi:ABC-type antimicrobial peptide transport system permease subunit
MYAGPRFAFLMMAIFGTVGLILVTIGVYSVLAYTTARRTHEIGIRMALGAEGADVISLVIKNGLRLVTLGLALAGVYCECSPETLRIPTNAFHA